ncbi:Lipid-binding SYLF domain-containing protein [Mariprofundus aestuarium]|uniref:Lipid-binding SYLF domain-containing protein n=2 Tax=Mariprofundus aestuarium TaxID=1921086 RepID=A0A2K8L8L9_MARES|nr:YSC84-related protein [Mariprofundus aestuarium]ATX80606.1 Lipid-binding SYLF domain-containing protein [Mariprofundus aestuarium]
MKTTTIRFGMLCLALSLLCLPAAASAASKQEINAKVTSTMTTFYSQVKSGKELANKAVAILVFPEVFKAGIGIGGEYGEGAMLEGGKTTGYYNTAAASIGFQLGAQMKSQVIMFMTRDALKGFKSSDGWKAGVDGSVALVTIGAGGDIDTNTIKDPIIGFIFSNKGLMYNLTFEGSKITKLDK